MNSIVFLMVPIWLSLDFVFEAVVSRVELLDFVFGGVVSRVELLDFV